MSKNALRNCYVVNLKTNHPIHKAAMSADGATKLAREKNHNLKVVKVVTKSQLDK